jgi:hypothetical protein
MADRSKARAIDNLIRRGAWEKARRALEKELADDPENHWLLT